MRSAITVCSTAVSSPTPWTVTKAGAAAADPRAILVRNAMTSSTSGSSAQLSITVVPGASEAP